MRRRREESQSKIAVGRMCKRRSTGTKRVVENRQEEDVGKQRVTDCVPVCVVDLTMVDSASVSVPIAHFCFCTSQTPFVPVARWCVAVKKRQR